MHNSLLNFATLQLGSHISDQMKKKSSYLFKKDDFLLKMLQNVCLK